jgi:SAM-dependent methyltransferase
MKDSRVKDSKKRFSGRVGDYDKYRPDYPVAIIGILGKNAGLAKNSVIADVGSGTGISAELFLGNGNMVYGVEPNPEMRQAAKSRLTGFPAFHSIDGTAENTTLARGSVDFVVAAQAFHWFHSEATKNEFLRILRPGGKLVLIWNARRTGSSEFLKTYESFLLEHGTDYRNVNHRNLNERDIRSFFHTCQRAILYNEQYLDFDGLKGRVLSSSYVPSSESSKYGDMMVALEGIFHEYNVDGRVRIEYDTEIYYGDLR